MDWKSGRRSNNIDDQRNSPLSAGVGGLGLVFRLLPFLLGSKMGRIILLIGGLAYAGAHFLGIDIMQIMSGGQAQPVAQASNTEDQELVDFVAVVLADTEQAWRDEFKKMGKVYQEPILVLFKGRVNSACGLGQAATGPFYCSGDNKLYIDLSFYEQLKNTLGAPGDFAQAYVIAHEIGHHVQNQLGIFSKVNQTQQNISQAEANGASVKLELQADCFAGIWAHHADRQRGIVEGGDIEEALTAAAAIGDDRLQQQSTGSIRPEKFTHGTSQQRVEWFNRGFSTGSVSSCNTFK